MSYKYLNHTADLGIEVKGETLEELFINTAKAIFETQIRGTILIKKKLNFEIKSSSLEELLIEWCRELIYNFSVNGFIPKTYDVKITKGFSRINTDSIPNPISALLIIVNFYSESF
ncbi:MAG: archease [candidate division WOR-3 bacterium]